MKKVISTSIKVVLAILLNLLPLLLCFTNIYKPIANESYMEFRSVLKECYYFFSFAGGIYYALLNSLLFLGRKSRAFFCGICGLLLYHITFCLTYFSFADVEDLGCAIVGLIASYHFLFFLLCFGARELAETIVCRMKRKKVPEDRGEISDDRQLKRIMHKKICLNASLVYI